VALRRPREAALARVAAVPAWAWVAAIVVVSAAVRYVLARRTAAPWIMVDELIYSELAKSFAASGHFLIRDHATAAYGVVYPALISPAWAIFDAIPHAYAAAKAINSVLMSLAAVPAYLLARRVLSRPYAVAAALLTVAVPSMVYTGTLMTENAFYPIFLLAALALVAWLERPTTLNTVLLLAVCALAFLTRAQAVALLPAVVTAPLLASGRSALRRYRLLYGIVAAAVVTVVVVQELRGASPLGVLGAYEVVSSSTYTVGGVSHWFLYHVAELDLSLGVLPFAALFLLAAQARRLPRNVQIFVAAAFALSFWLVLEVAAFASTQGLRIEERNMFYVAPLFLIALLAWIEQRAPRPAVLAVAAAALAAGLPAVLPIRSLINVNAVSDTLAILPLWSLEPSTFSLGALRAVVIVAAVVAGLVILLVPRRFALILPLLVLAYFAASQKPIEGMHRATSMGSLFAGITNSHPDWIDRAVGRNADVAAIWSGNTDRHAIWENEIFNRSVGAVYRTGPAFSGGLPEPAVSVARRTGLLLDEGKPIRVPYALTDGSLELDGKVLANDPRKGMLLYRVDGPLRQVSRVEGLYPQDTWSGKTVTYTRLECRGGSVSALLQSDPSLFKTAQIVRAEGRSVAVPRTGTRILRVPLRPHAGVCTVRFDVARTLVPAIATKGYNPDRRPLGVHFTRFTYHP
jgi:Dolichyl-phosphate-mannose-protein mannosyltransferase